MITLFSCCSNSEDESAKSNTLISDSKVTQDIKDITDSSKGVIDRFGSIYNNIHKNEYSLYDSLRKEGTDNWNYLFRVENVPLDSNLSTLEIDKDAIVFGWHPYWVGSAFESYHYNLLSHLSWFSYDVSPNTGKPNNPNVVAEWKNSGIIEKAHEAGCKAMLTITINGYDPNGKFLANKNQQQEKLINNLIELLDVNQADGIDINLEQIPPIQSKNLSKFIINLSNKIKAVNENYVISLILPKIDGKEVYEINKLTEGNIIDFFIIKGHDFHTRDSETDGPVSPLRVKDSPLSIEASVEKYIKKGLDKGRIVLSLPYYGALWNSNNEELYSKDRVFQRHLTYREIQTRYGDKKPKYDFETMSAYYIKKNNDNGKFEKCWFEDSLSLSYKYDWINEKEMKGVALWALGYDNSRLELWNTLANGFVTSVNQNKH